jgi:ATP-binding cassette subfamily B protein
LDNTVGGAIQLVVTVLGIASVLFWLNARLAVVTLVAVWLLAAFTVRFAREIRSRYRSLRETVGEFNTRLENNFSGIGVSKVAATEPYEEVRVAGASGE